MGHGFKAGAGGGGAALNFKVVAYASEEALLAAVPAENTIGVITTNKITGYIFSAEVPSEAVEGMVWFNVGTSSQVAFSATKKNPIMLYPLSAKQYVSGTWVDVTCKSYTGGQWVDWYPNNYIFLENKGVHKSLGELDTYRHVEGDSVTIGDVIVLTSGGASSGYPSVGTYEAYDLSEATTLYCDFFGDSSKLNNTTVGSKFGVSTSGLVSKDLVNNADGVTYNNLPFVASSAVRTLDERMTLSVDVSGIDSGYIIFAGMLSGTIYNMWWE